MKTKKIKNLPSTRTLEGVRVVIPMLNAARCLGALLPALKEQVGLDPAQVMVIDSASDDTTAAQCAAWGAEVLTIRRKDFNHGGTRRLAALRYPEARALLFMTQDAIPSGRCALARLATALDDPRIGVAYGRQIPRREALQIEQHARLYNYPVGSETRTIADAPRVGIKTYFCSNSFAIYRRRALKAIGEFPEEAYFGEDQIVAASMLQIGYALAYVSTAKVIHSHGYNLRQELARYFDVGVFHSRNAWLLDTFGPAEKAGGGFVTSEVRYLLRAAPHCLPEAALRTFIKYVGYQLGRSEEKLSDSIKARISNRPHYWVPDP